MFCFLISGLYYGFWSNKVGDEFVENTISGLHLTASEVSVVHYPNIYNVPEYFRLDGTTLIIQSLDIDGVTLVDGASHTATSFYENGTMILPC
jgi:hypothetical protein